MVVNQAYLSIIFIINGIIIGLLFDFFRILRRTFKTKDIITYIQDILFWIITGFILLYSIFTFNNGQIRLFMFLSVIIGIIVYIVFMSSHIIKINVTIINYLKRLLSKIFKILLIPLRYIYKVLKKTFLGPSSFLIINFRKISTNIYKKFNFNILKLKNIKNNVKN